MSILIKDMKMPTTPVLFCVHPDGKVFVDFEGGWREYQAVFVPPHGRLIDADALLKDDSRKYDMYRGSNGRDTTLDDTCHRAIQWTIEDAPTIIPAEGGEI